MNLFDEFGGLSPSTDSRINRDEDKNINVEENNGHLDTEHGLQEGVPEVPDSSKKEEVPQGWMRFIKLAYYQQYFRVSEKEVIERITYSILTPYQPEFAEITRANPDFYGPFWVLTTLILLLGFVGNFSNYLLSKFSNGEVWDKYFFKLELIRYAVSLMYIFGIGVPVVLYFIIKFKAERMDLALPNIICLYGYSLFCFIPAMIVCILPLGFLQWLSLLYAFGNSSLFLKSSLQRIAKEINPMILAAVIVSIQFILMLFIKLIFVSGEQ